MPCRCALLVILPAYPKQECKNDALEDEMEIVKVLTKSGFGVQQRGRMMVNQPVSTASNVTVGEWW